MIQRLAYASVFAVALIAGAALNSGTAKAATTQTYQLVLTPNAGSGPTSGTGSFTIVAPTFGSSGFFDVGNGGLLAMSFTMSGGQVFNLTNATSAGVGFNFNGTGEVINNIGYTGQLMSFVLQLSTGGFTYSFNDNAHPNLNTSGTITATLAAVPLPAALPLFATGLAGLGFFRVAQETEGGGSRGCLYRLVNGQNCARPSRRRFLF